MQKEQYAKSIYIFPDKHEIIKKHNNNNNIVNYQKSDT